MDDDGRPQDLNSAALLRARAHPALTGLSGAGVVVCVIDYGFDLLHPALRTTSGETRFAALIDQNGSRLVRSEINRLIRACERDGDRSALDDIYDPHANYFGRDGVQVGAHGSWVASIAAGSRTAEFCGVAPGATLIGLQLNLPDRAWREEDTDGRPAWIDAAAQRDETLSSWRGWRSYEESSAIVHALEASYELARALRPDGIVINLSIGAWAGGHDGNSPVNQAIDAITANGKRPGEPTAVVVTGTGNAGADRGHVSGALTGDTPFGFHWSFDTKNTNQSKLEVWADCEDNIAVDIRSPFDCGGVSSTLDGSARGTSAIMTHDGQLIGVAENRGAVRGSLRAVRVLLHPGLVSPSLLSSDRSVFDVSVRPERADDGGVVHAWIERDCAMTPPTQIYTGRCQTASTPSETGRTTPRPLGQTSLTSIACAASVIAVAGLNNAAADDAVLEMSGRGPRPWTASGDTPSPLLAAPANDLFGARSKTNGYMRGSGTSGAAAIVSGAAALALQAADIAGRKLDHDLLAAALLGRAGAWTKNADWRADRGFGAMRFDASAILSGTLTNAPANTLTSTPFIAGIPSRL